MIRERLPDGQYREAKLLEISPGGGRIKLKFTTGETVWVEIGEYVVEEVLADRRKKKPAKKRKKK